MNFGKLKVILRAVDCVKITQADFFMLFLLPGVATTSNGQTAHNPIIFADVPDMAMIRVGSTYYMGSTTKPVEVQRVALNQKMVYLKAECNFRDRKDTAHFFYSLDGKSWTPIGEPLKMPYTIPHFMGYRFGLFNYATQQPGGFADFDYFRIENSITD